MKKSKAKKAETLTLRTLIAGLREASKATKGKDVRVEVWDEKDNEYEIIQIGQFSVVPDVTITIRKVG